MFSSRHKRKVEEMQKRQQERTRNGWRPKSIPRKKLRVSDIFRNCAGVTPN